MRIRNIKPNFYRSDDIDALTWEERFLFIALWSYVDDNGVGRDKLSDICADLFAADLSVDPTETLRRVSLALDALHRGGLIDRYMVGNKPYLFISGWDRHQLVKNPNNPRYPRPDKGLLQDAESLRTSSVEPTEDLLTGTGEQGNRGTGEQRVGAPRQRGCRLPDGWHPSQELWAEMHQECPRINLEAEQRKFTDHWRAESGSKAIKLDWEATWRNWIRRARPTPVNGSSRKQEALNATVSAAMQRAAERDEANEQKAIAS